MKKCRGCKLLPIHNWKQNKIRCRILARCLFCNQCWNIGKINQNIYGEGQKDLYFLSTEIVALAYNNPQMYIGTFQTFQFKCHVRKIFHIRTTSIVFRAICKYYLINSTNVDRLKTLRLCSRWKMPGWRAERRRGRGGEVKISSHYGNISSICLSHSIASQVKTTTDKMIRQWSTAII